MYTGASGCAIEIRDGFVYKTGPATKILDEVKAYCRLRRVLGRRVYDNSFPRYSMQSRGEQGVLVTELLGEGKNLEWYLAEEEGYAYGIPIDRFAERAIDRLSHHASAMRAPRPEEGERFLTEMFESLEDALRRKGDALWQERMTKLRAHTGVFGGFASSPCHRDMGLHNIIPLRDGSVRFIDPHLRLSGARTLAIGSAEYDLVRFMANLTRMKFVYSWGCSAAVTNAIVNGLTGAFIELCFALVYTRYAACPCAQCTSVPGLLQTMEAESNRWLRIVERRLQ